MSGQWEVVGKKKDKTGKLNLAKGVKDAKKKMVPNGPKLEDVLPMSQVKSLYAGSGKGNKENQKPIEKNKIQENGTKKPEKKKEKPQETAKPKPPKSIESALNSINVEEFKELYEKTKLLFPDAPVVWLKELAQFLNQKVAVEIQDPVFSHKNEGFPVNVIPAQIKAVIEKSICDAGSTNAQLFFDISLTAMATDMSKGLPALGHKFYLQYIALNDPKIVAAGLSKHSVLRNSYQNRQSIGLSILWALGQTGNKDFNIGLKVFQEIMLPLIEMKNYSQFVVKYLVNLVNRHNKICLSKEQYLAILDIIFMGRKNFPTNLQQDLCSVLPNLKVQLFLQSSNDKYHGFIDPFLKKIQNNDARLYRNELCNALVGSLEKDKTSFGSWTKCYTKYLVGSAVLLSYIDTHWKNLGNKFNRKVFKDVLNTYSVTNDELMLKKRKEDGLLDSVAVVKKLTNKMATKKSSGFPFKSLSFLIIVTISALVFFDVKQNGSWEKSRTFTAAKDSGVYEYSLKAVDRTKQGASWMNERIAETFPDYYKVTVEYLEPFGDLAYDSGLVLRNTFHDFSAFVVEKYPSVLESIESYAPGLLEQSQQAVQNVWSTSVLYFNRSVDYLKKEVFVGQLSPENVQRVFLEAFNTTQKKATEYYHWIYEKVQTTIK